MDNIQIISKHLEFQPASLQAYNLHLHLRKRKQPAARSYQGSTRCQCLGQKGHSQNCPLASVANFLSKFSFKEPIKSNSSKPVQKEQTMEWYRWPWRVIRRGPEERAVSKSRTADSTDLTFSKGQITETATDQRLSGVMGGGQELYGIKEQCVPWLWLWLHSPMQALKFTDMYTHTHVRFTV